MIRHQPGVTHLVNEWQHGDLLAGDAALRLVYAELRRVAAGYLGHERRDHTLQPTALVHEAWLRLVGGTAPEITSRGHLIGIAAKLMRQILVNHARDRATLRRGGERSRVPLDPAIALYESRCDDLVALDDALARLGEIDERQARIVELRFFGNLTTDAIADLLAVSPRTVEREWAMARAWLHREVSSS